MKKLPKIKKITRNDNGTFTAIDSYGRIYNEVQTSTGNKVTGVTVNGKTITLEYDGDELIKVGDTVVDGLDVIPAPVPDTEDKTVTYTENGSYEVNRSTGKYINKVNVMVNVPSSKEEITYTGTITSNGLYEIDAPEGKVYNKIEATVNVQPPYGELEITENGTYDVKSYNLALVDVPNPSTGSLSITENGTYDVTEKASAVVNVPSAELNIAYGQTAPTDTTKLWVKSSAPSSVKIKQPLPTSCETENVANLPQGLQTLASAIVGDIIYTFGGWSSNAYKNVIYKYNTNTNEISTSLTTLPNATGGIAVASFGTDIYLFGGEGDNFQGKCYKFDTTNEGLSELSVTHYYTTSKAITVGNYIYVLGGSLNTSYTDKIWKFDPANPTSLTEQTVTLTNARMGLSVACVGNRIYSFGGWNGSAINSAEVYDTENDTVTPIANLPLNLHGGGASSFGKDVFIFRGIISINNYSNNVYKYDTTSNSYELLSTHSLTACYNFATSQKGNNVYLLGGITYNAINTIEKYTLIDKSLTNNVVLIATGENNFNIFPNAEMGVSAVYKGNTYNEAEIVEAYLYDEDEEEWVLI